MGRASSKLYADVQMHRVGAPKPHVVQESTVHLY